MEKKRKRLIKLFNSFTLRYKDSIRYVKLEKSKTKRVFYGVRKFGLSYILYNMARLRTPGLFWSIKTKLFLGRKMVWPASDVGANVFSMYGILQDKSERKLALWMIKNFGNSEIFYDVGAHLGYYTALSQELLTDGEVHVFEANNKLCEYLSRNFSNSKNVYILCTAVANSVGEVDFYDATKVEDSSASSRFNLFGTQIVPAKVSATTLDEYVNAGNNGPTVIKFDIEGGEYEAILGASNIIKKYKPRIIMEVWAGRIGRKYSDKAVKKLQELGYRVFSLDGDGSISKEFVNDPVGSIMGSSHGARDNFVFLMQ